MCPVFLYLMLLIEVNELCSENEKLAIKNILTDKGNVPASCPRLEGCRVMRICIISNDQMD